MKGLYQASPEFVQNIAVTLVNTYKYYRKFGVIPLLRPFKKVAQQLENAPYNDGASLERINDLIEQAVSHVPYYSENRGAYCSLKNIDDIKKLPILKKQTLKDNGEKFISKKSNRMNSYTFRTSGSTGTPLQGAVSYAELKARYRIFLISLNRAGIDYTAPLARFPGANIASRGSVYRHDYINNHFMFSIYHLSDERIQEYYDALNNHKVQILEGYPSTIYSMVKLLKSRGLKLNSVRHVLTTAEKLLDYQKEEIENFFNVKVFDFYGSSEGSAYMYLDEGGDYLNSNLIAYLETVNDNYKPVAKGELGRILVTSFTSSFTPLIRYDIGDIMAISDDENDVIRVSEILGRQEGIYITPSGASFGRFSLVLKYLPKHVQEAQLTLVQRSNQAKLFYVSDQKVDEKEFEVFREKMSSILRVDFEIEFNHLESFEKGNRGKLSAVKIISNEN